MRCVFKSLILFAVCAGALTACGGNDTSSANPAASAQSKQLQRSVKATTTASYQSVVQELYVAYYGRPADPAGLAYWEGVLLAASAPTDIEDLNTAYGNNNAAIQSVVNAFGNSAESTALYGNATSFNASSFITAIYQNVLGRAPDGPGLTYWAGLVGANTITQADAALSIAASAASEATTSSDEQIVSNRLAAAIYFTTQVTSQNATNAYSGTAANVVASNMLAGVTATTPAATYDAAANAAIATLLIPVNNVQAIIVDSGPDPVNIPALDEAFTTVTICAPANPTLCQTINHVLVDTGSSGLRLLSTVLTPSMASALSAQTAGSSTLVECTQFVDGYSWGPVRAVNFQIAGESTQAMAMQVIGDPNFSSLVPRGCSDTGPAENTVDEFGANGVIGVGLFQQDCGSVCVTSNKYDVYFTCSSSSCAATTASLAQQVPNPVSLFATDNNGVIIELPSVAAGGAVSVSGTMIFGVGTQSDNTLGSAAVFPMDDVGYFTTIFGGASLTESFIDSGSNGLYFPDTNIATCSDGFFCPSTQQNLSATMESFNSATPPTLVKSEVISFSIGNMDAALTANPSYSVYVPVGAPTPGDSFDWGLPFFFGRNVFVVTENKTVNGQTGPFIAF